MEFEFPGFRFHPTEEELLDFYLKNTVLGKKHHFDIIGFLDIYHHEPWNLPGLAKIGEREWYFFVPREKNGHGGRPNRTTKNGYWKATGSDRLIRCLTDPKKLLGHRKTLVFYQGRAPRGCKTDWIMNEYRLPGSCSLPKEIVLCKVYRKATSLKVLEQMAAREEVARASYVPSSCSLTQDVLSIYDHQENFGKLLFLQDIVHKVEGEQAEVVEDEDNKIAPSSMRVGSVKERLTEVQLPKFSVDWTMDPLWTQLDSP